MKILEKLGIKKPTNLGESSNAVPVSEILPRPKTTKEPREEDLKTVSTCRSSSTIPFPSIFLREK